MQKYLRIVDWYLRFLNHVLHIQTSKFQNTVMSHITTVQSTTSQQQWHTYKVVVSSDYNGAETVLSPSGIAAVINITVT
jgi:hypothetical protein